MPSDFSGVKAALSDTDERVRRTCAALLDELRTDCDRNSLRLMRLVEEALAQATDADQIETLSNGNATRVEKIEAIGRSGVARGFSLGVLAATLALQAILDPDRQAPSNIVARFGFSNPKGAAQLKLFD